MDTRAPATTTILSQDDGSFSFAITQVKSNLKSDEDEFLTWLCHASTRTDNEFEKIAELDEYFAKLKVMSFVDLSTRFFFNAPERAPYFIEALIRNTTIEIINFGTTFSRQSINSHIEKYLTNTTSLTQLVLRGVSDFTSSYDKRKLLDEDILHIARGLRSNASLEVLNLSFQTNLTDTSIRYLIDAVKMNSLSKLREIKIKGIHLSEEIKNELRKTLEPNVVKYSYKEILSRQQRQQQQTETNPTNIKAEAPKPF